MKRYSYGLTGVVCLVVALSATVGMGALLAIALVPTDKGEVEWHILPLLAGFLVAVVALSSYAIAIPLLVRFVMGKRPPCKIRRT